MQAARPTVLGWPDLRYFADDSSLTLLRPPVAIDGEIALSGGGTDGAFDAGVLVGLSDTRTRFQFSAVSGVNTAELIAPLHFLVPTCQSAHDDQCQWHCCHPDPRDDSILPTSELFAGSFELVDRESTTSRCELAAESAAGSSHTLKLQRTLCAPSSVGRAQGGSRKVGFTRCRLRRCIGDAICVYEPIASLHHHCLADFVKPARLSVPSTQQNVRPCRSGESGHTCLYRSTWSGSACPDQRHPTASAPHFASAAPGAVGTRSPQMHLTHTMATQSASIAARTEVDSSKSIVYPDISHLII
ncbi:hypothetical protein M2281_005390 [Mesorhizobium soli]|nr:hypothetical protein [Mesorhizobium soli]